MNKTKSLFVKSSNFSKSCILCKDDSHSLHKCEQFLHFSPQKRYETVRENHLCLNCLGFHKVAQCKSKHSCFHCKARHHSLLHRRQLYIVNDDSSPSLNASSTPADATPDTSSLSNRLTSDLLLRNAEEKGYPSYVSCLCFGQVRIYKERQGPPRLGEHV
ncbi:hypothetical protein AVEN_96735-1 [Araneus ventricosus]|uniref:Uncharacterized protein n=1 Tax=Araneus ventricosus TaxID=182803 RepID=A0A4Y2DL57_ARAVE|nr:hypothetical protein AVEN_210371-1 [Araneus ventricosus]GBM17570.1 hypothetical protein AVEN_96735-1 [Araneus ventricosus]